MHLRFWIWTLPFLVSFGNPLEALSAAPASKRAKNSKSSASSLPFVLQKCTTPAQVLQDVASKLSPNIDPKGTVASLTLVRLSKQCMFLQNEYLYPPSSSAASSTKPWGDHAERTIFKSKDSACSILKQVMETLSKADSSMETMVEGTKAAAILARLLPDLVTFGVCEQLLQSWESKQQEQLQVHQLSGLHWAFTCWDQVYKEETIQLPTYIQKDYDNWNLPFYFLPGYFNNPELTVSKLVDEVPFQVDTIRTTLTKQIVAERRETAWLGDEGVAPFAYSGKSMPRYSWSPLVKNIRDRLSRSEEHPYYYDGCLLNHYPDGGSAMRYHADPDQGTLWDYATAVVSVGASRRVAFRSIPPTPSGSESKDEKKQQEQPHTFVAMHGDVMVMVDECQSQFQHAVKPAENKQEVAARASLVFKKTLQ